MNINQKEIQIGNYIFVLAGGTIFAGWITEISKGLITYIDTKNMIRKTQPEFVTNIQITNYYT